MALGVGCFVGLDASAVIANKLFAGLAVGVNSVFMIATGVQRPV